MSEPLANVTLQCGHVFHGSCIVESLRQNNRCPICRDAPNQQDTDSIVSDDVDLYVDQGISFRDALKLANAAGRSDKNIAKRKRTIAEWTKKEREHRKGLKRCYNTLSPLEDKLEKKILSYTDRLWDAFDVKNRALIHQLAEHEKALKNAKANKLKRQRSLAETQGYIPHQLMRRNPRYVENDDSDASAA